MEEVHFEIGSPFDFMKLHLIRIGSIQQLAIYISCSQLFNSGEMSDDNIIDPIHHLFARVADCVVYHVVIFNNIILMVLIPLIWMKYSFMIKMSWMYLKWGKKMISAGIYSCGNYFKIELQRETWAINIRTWPSAKPQKKKSKLPKTLSSNATRRWSLSSNKKDNIGSNSIKKCRTSEWLP